MSKLTTKRILGIALLVISASCIVWLSIQDFHAFLVEDKGVEFYQRRPGMIAVCLAIGLAVGLAAHVLLERKKRKSKKGSEALPEDKSA